MDVTTAFGNDSPPQLPSPHVPLHVVAGVLARRHPAVAVVAVARGAARARAAAPAVVVVIAGSAAAAGAVAAVSIL